MWVLTFIFDEYLTRQVQSPSRLLPTCFPEEDFGCDYMIFKLNCCILTANFKEFTPFRNPGSKEDGFVGDVKSFLGLSGNACCLGNLSIVVDIRVCRDNAI